jgi:glutamine amidotransferase
MCRVLAYIGPELPLDCLLLTPENSLINQSLDPELHHLLQLAGWGFGAWSDSFNKPERPYLYRRPMAAFYDDNAKRTIPSLSGHTMLAHIRAAAYDASTVLVDENCHPFSFEGTPWIIAQNGYLPHWRLLQRDLLQHCKPEFIKQMRGSADTEFFYVLLMSLIEGDSDSDVQKGFERLLELVLHAMKKEDLLALTKLKIALVAPRRIIGINYGAGPDGRTDHHEDWRELRKSKPGSDDYSLSMLLEPMYAQLGTNFQNYEDSYKVDTAPEGEATSAIFASEPLTEDRDDWLEVAFNEMISLRYEDGKIVRSVSQVG